MQLIAQFSFFLLKGSLWGICWERTKWRSRQPCLWGIPLCGLRTIMDLSKFSSIDHKQMWNYVKLYLILSLIKSNPKLKKEKDLIRWYDTKRLISRCLMNIYCIVAKYVHFVERCVIIFSFASISHCMHLIEHFHQEYFFKDTKFETEKLRQFY